MATEKIVSMERTDAEKKRAEDAYKCMPTDGPDYPYGLCLSLGKEELAKLGITALPAVGDEFHVIAVACVTGVRQSASEGGEEYKTVDLQITAMGVQPEAESDNDDEGAELGTFAKAAGKLYKDS